MVTFAIIVKHIVHIRDFPTWRDFGQSREQLLEKREPEVVPYLIFVIFFTLAKFLEHKIYTEKRQFFALNL